MKLLITGALGNIGRRVMNAYPDAIGLDRVAGTDITYDLSDPSPLPEALERALESVAAIVHLGTVANPDAPEAEHFNATIGATRLVKAAALHTVPKLVLASSNWAEPTEGLYLNAYAYSKRIIEELAEMYRLEDNRDAVALRIGWVPRHVSEVDNAEDWLAADYWDDARLLQEIATALKTS